MMTPIFDRKISVFSSAYDVIGATMTVGSFLFDSSHKDYVQAIRAEKDEEKQKKMKKLLPQATISGTFSQRNANGLINHSGLICIDIDGKDNPLWVGRWEDLKKQLAGVPQIAYCALSVRGNGLFAIIPIKYPRLHLQHFLKLQEDFQQQGLKIDKSCKDVSRMRCVSYDEVPVINPSAKEYCGYKVEEKPIRKVFTYAEGSNELINKVAEKCATIDAKGIDLTAAYVDWFKIGCALANLGEAGREFYHVLSRQNASYNETECDKKFTNLLAKTSRISIATFFYYCKQWGV